MAATVFVTMGFVDRLYHLVTGSGGVLAHTDIVHAAIDIFACAALVVIALQANRNYTLWLAGFQLVATVAHLARGLVDTISPIAYAMMYIAPSYLQIITLGLGIWLHHQRVQRHGNYRSWRSSSPRSRAIPPTN
jgi:hypothetical protein